MNIITGEKFQDLCETQISKLEHKQFESNMHSIDIDISGVNRTSLIRLIDVLLHKKRESFLNLNPKIFYDNLLIELRENI